MTSLDALDPAIRDAAKELIRAAGAAGLQPRVTSTLRTFSEQQRLYRAYLAGTSKFPAAPPGTSAHEFGAAFDVVLNDSSYLSELGGIWESWGGVWGGRFHDEIHFEAPGFSHAPAGRENWIQQIARLYDQLPWWIQMMIPVQLTAITNTERNQINKAIQDWLGWHP